MLNKREIKKNKDQCKHRIYVENPLKEGKIRGRDGWRVFTIFNIGDYNVQGRKPRKILTSQNIIYLTKIDI